MNLKKIGLLLTAIIMTTTAMAQSFKGDWKGALSVQGMEMEIIFHIDEKEGAYSTTMDVPKQGAAGIPIQKTEVDGSKIIIDASNMGIVYNGQLEGKEIKGEFKQAGMTIPLNLKQFESKLPGDVSLPSSKEELKKMLSNDNEVYKYKVEDYFAKPKASSFQLSPDGKYMSYREKDAAGKRHIYVKNIKTGAVTKAIEEKNELVKGYGWINNERLYFSMDKGGDENFHVYAANIDGTNSKDLTPFDGVQANITNILKDQKDYVIISMNKNNPRIFEPFKLNVVTGELEQLFENKDEQNPIQGFQFDKDGNLRGYAKMVGGTEQEIYYKDLKTGKFNLLKRLNWKDNFNIVTFNYASDNKDEAYVASNLESDKVQLYRYDLKKNKVIEKIFSHPEYDVSSLSISKKRGYELDNFSYNGEKVVIVPVSKFYKSMVAKMKKEFGDKQAYIVDKDDNETKFLIVITSDKIYAKYYEYDVKSGKFSLLYDLMPQLKEEDMAPMRPISFTSRDGLKIHGYITLPKAALRGEKVPMIVNPHGGPQGVRDSWGFNPETQLFASRGYATLQVNFRISGGYGKKFLRAGFKQIGRNLMNDIEDGVKYAIEQGWADKDKIAIYGASHGGYATLMGLVKTPDLYTCGVNYVGVSNIFTFFESFPEYWKPYKKMIKEIWYDVDNPEEAKIAKEVSPVFQIDKIKKPLFVVQGANDPRVKIAESDQIVTALRAKGYDVPYLVKYNEGHGFQREDNSLELYKYMLGFFAKHLKK